MIISASRRTDIPAFYADWFINRVKAGFVCVRNPMNFNNVSKISLKPEDVDFIVFWTKNPKNILDHLRGLNDFLYYFQFTITSYNQKIEKQVDKKEIVIERFKRLSDFIGKERVIWRYDPIMVFGEIDKYYHYKYFEYLAKKLHRYTNKCVVSFVDVYRKNVKSLREVNLIDLGQAEMFEIMVKIKEIAESYDLTLETCAEETDFAELNIRGGKCIDNELISTICSKTVVNEKDKYQREECGCITSVDIGSYNTCPNRCVYCYANFSEKAMMNNCSQHDVNSPLLFGVLNDTDKITERKMPSIFVDQENLF